MFHQAEERRQVVKKLDTAAHNESNLGCDAANVNVENPHNVFSEPIYSVTFTGRVENYVTEIVVDSGSGISLISLDLFNLINKHAKVPLDIISYSIVAKSATGDSLDIVGKTVVEIDVGQSKWFVQCYVAKNFQFPFLLGTDFLVQTGTKLDMSSLQATIGQDQLSISVVKRPRRVPVSIVNSLEIPARSEAILEGRISGIHGTVLVEPKYEVSSHDSLLYPARTIANVDNSHIPVKVVNTNFFPVKICAGTCIGMAEQFEEAKIHLENGKSNSDDYNVDSWLNEIDLQNCALSEHDRVQLLALLQEYRDVFVKSDTEFGRAHRFTHEIDTGDNPPFRQRPYRLPHAQLGMIDKHIQSMLDKGVIQESDSPWSQPLVIVTKKDGSPRFCVDFRKLNCMTKKHIFPMPRVDEVLDSLGDSCYFTTLDLASGYWQIPLKPEDREKTAFCTRQGNFEFRVMPMGLVNASYSFQKMMQLVLSGLQWQICMVYLDDIIVYSKSFQKHLENLRSVFDRFRHEGLRLKPKKCHFCKPEVLYLGHVIGKDGIRPNPVKIEVITNYPVPCNCDEVRSFVALVSYYRRFVKGFATIAAPLNALLKKGVKFNWTEDCQHSFETLRDSLIKSPILAYPDFQEKFSLYTDASNTGIGAILAQHMDGEEKTISYASRSLKTHERKYATIERECLALVWGIKHFRPYLYGKEFEVITDHNPLKWLGNARDPHSRLSRWSLALQSYAFSIKHRPGKLHGNVDSLSRLPDNNCNVSIAAIDSPGLQLDRVKDLQRKDPALQDLIKYLETGDIPDNSVDARRLMATSDDYLLDKGVLYHLDNGRIRSRKIVRKQLVIPRSLKEEVMLALHEELTSGHLSFQKTYLKIRQRYFWTGMFTEIQKWCASCVDCATKQTPRNLPKAPLQPIPVEGPFDRIAVDVLGPFPTSEQGNKYVTIFTDYFTKWTEAFAVKNADALTTAKLFVEEILCHHSAPRALLSDRGKNFLSKVVKGVCQLVNTAKVNTTSYHPECDGLVERFNHTFTTIISMYVSEHQKDWDHFIPYALFAYRTAVQTSTNETPFYLMYGRDPRLPIDATLLEAQETYENTDDYRRIITDGFLDARKLTKDNIELAQQRQKTQYDKTAKDISYDIGQRVWLYTPNKRKGLLSKLTHNWHGPFRILAKKSPVNYLLDSNDERNYIHNVHVNRLKPFVSADIRPETDLDEPDLQENPDSEPFDNVSERDPAELAVKSIIDKKVVKNQSGCRQTYYLVEWEDADIEPSWEPLSHLHCSELLKEFEYSLLSKKSR